MAADNYSELNLDKAFRKWAKAMYGNDQVQYKFNLERVKFLDSRPIFTVSGRPQSLPTTQVIFEDTFRNDTSLTQKHRIRCVRQTTSHTKVDMQQAIVCSERTRLNLSELPGNIANKSGFLNEIEIEKIKTHDFKEKLIWEVDDKIEVPAGSIIRAEVMVSEEQQEAEFTVKTTMRGNVHCDVTELDGEFRTTIDGDVTEILKKYAEDKKQLAFPKSGGVQFTSKGICQFRYGVQKKVNVYSDEN